MKIIEISKFYSVEGAYSTVLIDNNRKVVLKLFKSYDHPDLNGTDKEKYGKEKIDSFRREVFISEVEAYNKLLILNCHTILTYISQLH